MDKVGTPVIQARFPKPPGPVVAVDKAVLAPAHRQKVEEGERLMAAVLGTESLAYTKVSVSGIGNCTSNNPAFKIVQVSR